MRITPVLLLIVCLARGQNSEPPKRIFEDHAAFLLSNGTLELTVLARGSSFASVVLVGDPEKLSPYGPETGSA